MTDTPNAPREEIIPLPNGYDLWRNHPMNMFMLRLDGKVLKRSAENNVGAVCVWDCEPLRAFAAALTPSPAGMAEIEAAVDAVITAASWKHVSHPTKDSPQLHREADETRTALLEIIARHRSAPETPAIPAGWKLVPIEPTEEMAKAGARGRQNNAISSFRSGWTFALAAVPPTPTPDVASNPGMVETDGQYVRNAYKVDGAAADEGEFARNTCELEAHPVTLRYTNHRGETADRTITPTGRMLWTSNKWHPEPQWLIEAEDERSGEMRLFALKGFAQPAIDEALRQARADAWERAISLTKNSLKGYGMYGPRPYTAEHVAKLEAALRAAAKAEGAGS